MLPIHVLILGHSFIRRLNDFLHSWFGCHDTRVKQKVRSVSGILKINLVELNKLQTEIVIIDPRPYQSTQFSYTVKRIECSAKVPRHFVLTTKTTQPRPQVFSVNGSITCIWSHFDVILPWFDRYTQAFKAATCQVITEISKRVS